MRRRARARLSHCLAVDDPETGDITVTGNIPVAMDDPIQITTDVPFRDSPVILVEDQLTLGIIEAHDRGSRRRAGAGKCLTASAAGDGASGSVNDNLNGESV